MDPRSEALAPEHTPDSFYTVHIWTPSIKTDDLLVLKGAVFYFHGGNLVNENFFPQKKSEQSLWKVKL